MNVSLTDVRNIAIDVKVHGEETFSLVVNREGKGHKFSNSAGKGEMQCFQDDESLFQRILDATSPALLLRRSGRFEFPERKGEEFDLKIVLQIGEDDKNTKAFEFIYGSESKAPPKEIMDIVRAALA